MAKVEKTFHEAEDQMLALPYAQLHNHFDRLAVLLEDFRLRALVLANPSNPSSELVDPEFLNVTGSVSLGYVSLDEYFVSTRETHTPSKEFNESADYAFEVRNRNGRRHL
jgi:hypothetical protein